MEHAYFILILLLCPTCTLNIHSNWLAIELQFEVFPEAKAKSIHKIQAYGYAEA